MGRGGCRRVRGTTRTSAHAAGRRPAAAILAFAILAVATSAAVARSPIEGARHHVDALGRRVEDARGEAARLQTRIVRLTAGLISTRDGLDRLEAKLVEAQHGLAASRAELDDIQTRLNERARDAFIGLGPVAS